MVKSTFNALSTVLLAAVVSTQVFLAQTHVQIPSSSFDDMDIVEISLKPRQAKRYIIATKANKLLKAAVDTDNPEGIASIRLVNGNRKIDKWFDDVDDFEALTGRDGDYIVEIKNLSNHKYSTNIFFTLGDPSEYRNINARDYRPVKNIRDFDFKNFLCPPVVGDIYYRTRLKSGEAYLTDDKRAPSISIDQIYFADINSDGHEEAFVAITEWGGGSGFFSDAFVFKLINGYPKVIDRFGVGDRSMGGLRGIRSQNGIVYIDRNDAGTHGGACCTEFITTDRYKWDGKHLSIFGSQRRRSLFPFENVRFNPGESSATKSLSLRPGVEGKRFVLKARAGQTLTVLSDNPNLIPYLLDGDAKVTKTSDGFEAKLNKNGEYRVLVSSSGESEITGAITLTIR